MAARGAVRGAAAFAVAGAGGAERVLLVGDTDAVYADDVVAAASSSVAVGPALCECSRSGSRALRSNLTSAAARGPSSRRCFRQQRDEEWSDIRIWSCRRLGSASSDTTRA